MANETYIQDLVEVLWDLDARQMRYPEDGPERENLRDIAYLIVTSNGNHPRLIDAFTWDE